VPYLGLRRDLCIAGHRVAYLGEVIFLAFIRRRCTG
jgi:hypothetical protein